MALGLRAVSGACAFHSVFLMLPSAKPSFTSASSQGCSHTCLQPCLSVSTHAFLVKRGEDVGQQVLSIGCDSGLGVGVGGVTPKAFLFSAFSVYWRNDVNTPGMAGTQREGRRRRMRAGDGRSAVPAQAESHGGPGAARGH